MGAALNVFQNVRPHSSLKPCERQPGAVAVRSGPRPINRLRKRGLGGNAVAAVSGPTGRRSAVGVRGSKVRLRSVVGRSGGERCPVAVGYVDNPGEELPLRALLVEGK